MLKFANLLIQYNYYNEAFFFYHLIYTKGYLLHYPFTNKNSWIIHNALLSMARILFDSNSFCNFGSIKYTIEIANNIFNYLVDEYDSAEAKDYIAIDDSDSDYNNGSDGSDGGYHC